MSLLIPSQESSRDWKFEAPFHPICPLYFFSIQARSINQSSLSQFLLVAICIACVRATKDKSFFFRFWFWLLFCFFKYRSTCVWVLFPFEPMCRLFNPMIWNHRVEDQMASALCFLRNPLSWVAFLVPVLIFACLFGFGVFSILIPSSYFVIDVHGSVNFEVPRS